LPLCSAGHARTHVPGAYIFELDHEQDTSDFYATLGSEGTTRLKLDYTLFKGVSVQLDDVDNAEAKASVMASAPAVKNVWPVELYDRPNPKKSWAGTPSRTPALSKRDNTSDTYSPHVMTQIDKLHGQGITGKGIKIAVVDTGIDYTHPALGGCFGEGCLVSFGTDLVGDAYNGYNEHYPDDDPMDCDGHGTHVAGIIAAQENSYGFKGAAPDANLGIYKVFGCEGNVANDVLIAAFNQAYEDGADIITSSIGGPSGWSDEAWSKAVSAIVDKGVPCTISAGNDGDAGLFFASTAANGINVASIASYDNILTPTFLYISEASVDGGDAEEFGYAPASLYAWDGVSLPLWAPEFDTSIANGGCDAYPDDTPDLSGSIVLVRRGTCTFVQKAQNAVAHGAKYLIVYNNVAGASEMDLSTASGIEAGAMVTPDIGVKWINLLKDGSEIVLNMTGPDNAESTVTSPPNNVTGGALSTYTTWGPTWDLKEVNPSFGSPGGDILSTYPVDKGGFAVLSGTSMACPLVAGAFALFAEARGTLEPEVVRNAFSAEAKAQLFNDGTSFYSFMAPVPQQGSGIIQAYDAVHTKTSVVPGSLSFGITSDLTESLNFTLSNDGDEDITYSISHIPTVTMYTLNPGSIYPAAFPNEPVNSAATLAFSETKVLVAAGDSVVLQVVPTPPKAVVASRLPVWSGWVAVNASDGSSLTIPYNGVSGNFLDQKVLSSTAAWVSNSTDSDLNPLDDNVTFILPPKGTENTDLSNSTIPAAVANLALGSPLLRADIIPVGQNNAPTTTDIFDTPFIGQPDGFPVKLNPRSANTGPWSGRLSTGEYAPEGQYKFILRALRIGGDASKKADWDSAETTTFSIKYAP
ncbi:Serine protease, subtilisin family, partial [Geosmithia morbida]